MDTALFLEQFGHLAQSPDGVQKLRGLILDLAVRGRLVPQNPDDEPASELLKCIEAEKENLVRAGQLKKADKLPPIADDEKPYTLPQEWEWTRMQNIFDVRDGTHATPKYITGDGIPLITSKDFVNGEISFVKAQLISLEDHLEIKKRSRVDRYDILFSMIGGNIGNQVLVNITKEFSIKNVALFKYYSRDLTLPWYLKRFLEYLAQNLQSSAIGGAQPFVSLSYLRNIAFPLPPLAEQHRIVAKVDELMQLCDQLEHEQAQRDQLQASAAKSTLHHLTAASTKDETLQYWQHTEQHFAALFDRVSTVEELRAAILELAVRGRLVPQNPDDEPASQLLKRIEAEKETLVRAGRLKKSEKLPPLAEDEKPYELPHGWEWTTASQFCDSVASGSTPSANEMFTSQDDQANIPFLKVYNLTHDGSLNFPYRSTFIRREIHTGQLNRSRTYPGDVLMNIVGPPLGKISLVPDTYPEWNINQAIVSFRVSPLINNKYFCYLLLAPNTIERFVATSKATTNQFNLNVTTCRTLPFPLPPLAEQHRIVAKLDELIQLCDRLEYEATQKHEISAKLMDSVIYHLFEPAAAH